MTVTGRGWRALGTTVHVLVTDGAAIDEACQHVSVVLDRADMTFSRFRPDSELRRAGARASVPVQVSPLLGQAIATALRAARLTDGAVDPTVGRALRLIGYDDDFDRIGGGDGSATIRVEAAPGWRSIDYDASTRTLRLRPGIELDLGSTGKALASDLAAEAAFAATGAGVLVNLGGDIAIAGPPPDDGWRVLVADDARTSPGEPGETVALASGALATSSTTVRRWRRGDIELHHIVDPATGLPAVTPWRTVTVAAATCVDANTAATAAILRGEAAPPWLAARRLAARLVDTSGAVTRVAGWPEPPGTPGGGVGSGPQA